MPESDRKPSDWPYWRIALVWALAIVWLILMESAITKLPAGKWLDVDHDPNAPWYTPGNSIEPVLRATVRLMLRAVQGLVLFLILAWPYYRPLRLVVLATFPEDAAPQLVEGAWTTMVRRLLEWVTFYSNLLSLSAIRRFVYVAFNPFLPGRGWRVSLIDLGPGRIIQKLRIYIETEMFTPKNEEESKGEYGERVSTEYVKNVRLMDRGETPLLQCQTCFDVFGDNEDAIGDYLTALEKVKLSPDFLCRIRFELGYVAPTYLISGSLHEFEADWTRLVNAYQSKLLRLTMSGQDPLFALPELRKLQSFIWDCWVQWGPSVPLCSARAWNGGKVAVQFGYGDENNSLPLILHGNASTFAEWSAPGSPLCNAASSTGWAWPVAVTGRMRNCRDERNQEFCPAQKNLSSRKDSKSWLVFEADSLEPHPGGPLFYSAYVWVAIVICHSTASDPSTDAEDQEASREFAARGYRLLHTKPKEYWRGLLPLFQHGNIAEASVFENVKRELAYKTIDTLLDQVRRADAAKHNWLHFAYAAALDDNGDGERSTLLVTPPGRSILSWLQEAHAEAIRMRPGDAAVLNRIHVGAESLEEFTASDLPGIVRNYLDQV